MQSVKNPIRKSINNFQLKSKAESDNNESINNGKLYYFNFLGNLDQSKSHKSWLKRGIWSVNGWIHKPSVPKLSRKALNTSTSVVRDSSLVLQKPENLSQLLIDNATRLEWAKCLELFAPNDFYEHIAGESSWKGSLWSKGEKLNIRDQKSDTASPIIKNKTTVKLNKENNLEDINPMSERGSYTSLYQANKKPQQQAKMTLPPHIQLSKERKFGNESDSNRMNTDHTRHSIDRSFRIPQNEWSWEIHHSTSFNKFGIQPEYINYPVSCKNNTLRNKDMCNLHSSMGFSQAIMTPMNQWVHESFVIQPHWNRNSVMHGQWGVAANDWCTNNKQNVSSFENFSHIYGPTIEDRLENTEKLIREMNAKFEDITSNKFSAKQEFNKLVQTLTMTSDRNNYNVETDSNEEQDDEVSSTEEQWRHSFEEKESNNSSFDEETCNLNQQNLKQILHWMSKKQKEAKLNKSQNSQNSKIISQYVKNSSKNLKSNSKIQERTGFSNSRYENTNDDCLDDEIIQYNDDRKSYMVPESKIDLHNYLLNSQKENDSDLGDQLYQNAKNSLARTKILLMSSHQDIEYGDQAQYEDNNQMLNFNSRRVKNILRNKHKRMLERQESRSKHTNQQIKEESVNDSESCKMQASSENDHEEYLNNGQNVGTKNSSRNYWDNTIMRSKSGFDPQRFIHQTTSSGNMVLYDSVMRASSQSPQELLDPNFIEAINAQHLKVYETQDDRNYNNLIEEDEIDILQNQRVAGKFTSN